MAVAFVCFKKERGKNVSREKKKSILDDRKRHQKKAASNFDCNHPPSTPLTLLVPGDPRARRVGSEHDEGALDALCDDGTQRAQVLARRGGGVGGAGRRHRRRRHSKCVLRLPRSLYRLLALSPLCVRERECPVPLDAWGTSASPCLREQNARERGKKKREKRERGKENEKN